MNYKILVTDDDDDDFFLIKQAFWDLDIDVDLKQIKDGRELIEYLSTLQEKEKKGSLPDLIVLDINMPVMGGLEALKLLRSNRAYEKVPIFMYTTSNSIEERNKCMQTGATAYFTKANTYEQVLTFVNNISRFIKVSNNPVPFQLADHRM